MFTRIYDVLEKDAVRIVEERKNQFMRGRWGDGLSAVCLMSALVPGARSHEDCVSAGWPEWLVMACTSLFDGDVNAPDELGEAVKWAGEVARAVSVPVNYGHAAALYASSVLEFVDETNIEDVSGRAVDLVSRLANGEDTYDEIDNLAESISDIDTMDIGRSISHRMRLVTYLSLKVAIDYETPSCPVENLQMRYCLAGDFDYSHQVMRQGRQWLIDALMNAGEEIEEMEGEVSS